MRRLAYRVGKLERAFGAAMHAPCRVCGGGGRPGIQFRVAGEPPRPVPACTGCGKSKVLRVIVLEATPPDRAGP